MSEKIKYPFSTKTTSFLMAFLTAAAIGLSSCLSDRKLNPNKANFATYTAIPSKTYSTETPKPKLTQIYNPTITPIPFNTEQKESVFLVNFSGLLIEIPKSSLTSIPWEYLPESTRIAAQSYESIILEAVKDFGENVDRDLCRADEDWIGFPAFLIAAIIQVESNGINEVHPSGAVGLMGIKIDGLTQEELLNPVTNIRVGTLMLCQIMNNHYRFQANGDIDTALAMYNAGDTAILEGKPLLPGEGYEYSDRVYAAAGFDENTIQTIRNTRQLKKFVTPTPAFYQEIK